MATTSSIEVAGKASGGRITLKSRLVAGAASIACAAALAYGGLQSGDSAQAPPMAPVGPSAKVDILQRQRFLEQNLYLPDGTLPASSVSRQQVLAWNTELPGGTLSAEQQRFLEVNTQLPDGTLPIARISAEWQRFLELNLYLPDGGTAAPIPSDQSTLR